MSPACRAASRAETALLLHPAERARRRGCALPRCRPGRDSRRPEPRARPASRMLLAAGRRDMPLSRLPGRSAPTGHGGDELLAAFARLPHHSGRGARSRTAGAAESCLHAARRSGRRLRRRIATLSTFQEASAVPPAGLGSLPRDRPRARVVWQFAGRIHAGPTLSRWGRKPASITDASTAAHPAPLRTPRGRGAGGDRAHRRRRPLPSEADRPPDPARARRPPRGAPHLGIVDGFARRRRWRLRARLLATRPPAAGRATARPAHPRSPPTPSRRSLGARTAGEPRLRLHPAAHLLSWSECRAARHGAQKEHTPLGGTLDQADWGEAASRRKAEVVDDCRAPSPAAS